MQFAEERNSQHVSRAWSQNDSRPELSLQDFLLLLRQFHRVVMDGVSELVADGARELLVVFHEIEQLVHYVDVASRRCERIRLRFVYQVELDRQSVARLRRAGDVGCQRL